MKIGYNQTIGEVFYTHPVTNEEILIFMTEDINPDAINSLIDQYNSEYSLNRIKINMEEDDRLTGDEIDYIIEQLELFEEGQEAIEKQPESAPWREEKEVFPSNLDSETATSIGGQPATVIIGQGTVTDTAVMTQEEINKNIPKMLTDQEKAELQMVEQPKVKKTRQPRTTPAVSGGKAISPQDYIKVLQEKIELTKLLSETVAPEIPENLTKQGRDLMIKFSQDHNKLIVDYLSAIQTM